MFYTWLQVQQSAVCHRLAIYIKSDPDWPRATSQLSKLLIYCDGKDPALRRTIKQVHKLWRDEAVSK